MGGEFFEKNREQSQRVYLDLRSIAGTLLDSEWLDHERSPTELVHEVFVDLRSKFGDLEERAFLAYAAKAMRHWLVNNAKKIKSQKRGGGWERREVTSSIRAVVKKFGTRDFVALSKAIVALKQVDPRVGRVVELRYFFDRSLDRIADELGESREAVKKHQALGLAWLERQLGSINGG